MSHSKKLLHWQVKCLHNFNLPTGANFEFFLSFDCSSVADVSNFLFKLDDATNLVKEHENIHSVDDFTDPIRSQFPQRLLQMLKLFIFNVKK